MRDWAWRWDHTEGLIMPNVLVARWRRGPVTFYRYRLSLPDGAGVEFWALYLWDDFGFACVRSRATEPTNKEKDDV